jgi:hypothetical protein
MQVSKTQNPADLPDSDDSVVTQPLHRMTPEERRAFGAARRKQLRRQAHAQWFAEDRRSDPMALLEESSSSSTS